MKKIIDRVIAQYGSSVKIVNPNGNVYVQAFLQLVTSKSWQNMERMIPAGGEIKRGQFLYIGPANASLDKALRLECGGRVFRVRRADNILFQNIPLFIWGLCVEGGPEDSWSSS